MMTSGFRCPKARRRASPRGALSPVNTAGRAAVGPPERGHDSGVPGGEPTTAFRALEWL